MDELDAEGEMIALIISDHVMPGKTGVELLTEISKDSRFIRTRKVLLTGQAEQLVECVRNLVTKYIFDMRLDYTQYHEHLDQNVVFDRLR